MGLLTGQTIVQGDFVSTSSGAGDSGKVAKLNASGKIINDFLLPNAQYISTAGESIAAGNAVFVADGTEVFGIQASGTEGGSSAQEGLSVGGYALSQSFTVPTWANKITVVSPTTLHKTGSPSGTIFFEIYATSSHKPTGAALASVSQALSSTAPSSITFNLTVTGGTEYAFVIRMTGETVTPTDQFYPDYADTGVTAVGYYTRSTNGGSTWGSAIQTTQITSIFNFTGTIAGRVYLASANSNKYSAQYYNNFMGFAQASVSAAASVHVAVTGVDQNQTSLTVGSIYYLSNTLGSIGTSAGAQSRKAGVALSATEILMRIV